MEIKESILHNDNLWSVINTTAFALGLFLAYLIII